MMRSRFSLVLRAAAAVVGLAAPGVTQDRTPLLHPDGTTHWYQAVSVFDGVTWAEANRRAAAAGGYLVTINSDQENDLVFRLIDDPTFWAMDGASGEWNGPWIGARRDPSANPSAGFAWAIHEPLPTPQWAPGKPTFTGAAGIHFGGSKAGRIDRWSSSDLTTLLPGYVIEFAGARTPQTIGLQLPPAGVAPGYTLFSPIRSSTTYLIDAQGREINSWTSAFNQPLMAYLLPNGNLVRVGVDSGRQGPGGGVSGIIEEFTWQGKAIWQFGYHGPDYMGHHDIELLPNGNYLMIVWEAFTLSQCEAAGFDPALLPTSGRMWPDKLVEIQPVGTGGRVVWEWRAWDHLVQEYDVTKANFGVVANHPELIHANYPPTGTPDGDWMHSNAIDYHPGLDQVVLSVRAFSELWVIDHSTTTAEAASHTGGRSGKGGDLLYRWGNPAAYNQGTRQDQQLFAQHDTQWIEPGLPGAGNILIFNNGNGRGFSSVTEIVPPPVDAQGNYAKPGAAYGPAAPVWEYAPQGEDRFFAPFICGAQRLANGNTLVCDGPVGRLFEIEPSGKQVWSYTAPVGANGVEPQGGQPVQNFVFRATRIEPGHPGLAGKVLTPGEPVEIYTEGLLVEGSRLPSEVSVGSRVSLRLKTRRPNWNYQVVTSATPGMVEFNHRFLQLGEDPLLGASLTNTMSSVFVNYAGKLDFRGDGNATIALPNDPSLQGLELWSGFMAFDLLDPAGTVEFSNTVTTRIVL